MFVGVRSTSIKYEGLFYANNSHPCHLQTPKAKASHFWTNLLGQAYNVGFLLYVRVSNVL